MDKQLMMLTRILMKKILFSTLIILTAISCRDKIEPEIPLPPDVNPDDSISTSEPSWPENECGTSYVWDDDVIPEFHINIDGKQWNKILEAYDKNPDISSFFKCDVIFDKNGVRDTIKNTGIRLFGNADACRPEGAAGEKHNSEDPQWNFSNYELNFTYFVNKESHSLRKVNAVYLKSCYNDPSYARERYCYDLYKRAGMKIIGQNLYCKVNIHVEGDAEPAYLGIYQMIEPVSKDYITERSRVFGKTEGNLWKCGRGASLTPSSATAGVDMGKGEDFNYMLMTNQADFSAAVKQLSGFSENVQKLKNDEFYAWIKGVCDVELLMWTYAINVTVGMWDDYWNTGNNYYLYFNDSNEGNYKVFMIPYDFEMSLGNSRRTVMPNPAVHDPYNWGRNSNPLISRLLYFPEFKKMYTEALETLIMPEAYLFQHEISSAIISDLMYQVSFYTKNDTGLNMNAKDRTAGWSSHPEFKLADPASNDNFFRIRSESIKSYSE